MTGEGCTMRILIIAVGAAAVLLLGSFAARAQPLIVAEIEAPAIDCVFHPLYAFTVSDSVGFIPLPYLAAPPPPSCSRAPLPASLARSSRARPATFIASV